MPRLIVFNHISLDGYFTDTNNDISFARNPRPDKEWDEYVAGNASGEGMFVFGRVTYSMMESYWPTPAAINAMPKVAAAMNNSPKVVFSRSLDAATWQNTRLVEKDAVGEIRKLKASHGPDMVIFGSGSIVSQLTEERLIDEYTFIVNPVVLGSGRTMFEGVKEKVPLRLTKSRSVSNGNVMLNYETVT